MSTSVYLLTICLPLATILLVFGMKYFSAVFAARARAVNDTAWRAVAERAAAAQAENQAALGAIQAEVARLAASVAAIEKVLRQVE